MKCNFISRSMSVDINRMARLYFEAIDTPVSLGCWLRLKYDVKSYLELSIDPLEYNSPESFSNDYLAVKFLSKFDGFDVYDKDEAAREAFRKAEVQCAAANMRLDSGSPTGVVAAVFHRAYEKLSRVLPKFDQESLQEIVDSGRFGPGVTSSCKGDFTGIFNKFSSENHITPTFNAFLHEMAFHVEIPHHFSSRSEVPGNRVTTVPKNSKTNRTIAVEPHVNAYFQRGVGTYLKGRLKNGFGIDLSTQSNNQKAALAASLDGSYVTVDLAAASDTISIEIVRRLLPDHWIVLLESLRSEKYEVNGTWFRYHKHSSMGNGYTFELESIIFASLVYGVLSYLGIKKRFYVYGDDIIVPVEAYPLLLEVLEYSGFSVNVSKTHVSGYFRESCGLDAFHGTVVTPFYFKKNDDVVQVITFANWLMARKDFSRFQQLWRYLYFSVPKAWANKGPVDGIGVHFHVDPYTVPESLIKIQRHGMWCYRYASVIFKPTKRGVADSFRTVYASIRSLDMMNPPNGGTGISRHLRSVGLDDLPVYARQSVGRRRGKWCRKLVVHPGSWPVVR